MDTTSEILILDSATELAVDRCDGPTEAGLCPRVRAGERVACAGMHLLPARVAATGARPFVVTADMEVCPVSWLFAMAGSCDAVFFETTVVAQHAEREVAATAG